MHSDRSSHPIYHPMGRGLCVQTIQNMTCVFFIQFQASHTKLCASPWYAPMPVALDEWAVRKTEDGLASVIGVIAHVKRVSHRYAGQLYQRMSQAQRAPVCEARQLPPSVSDLTNAASPMQGYRRGCCRPAYNTPVAHTDQIASIIWQLPGSLQCRQECTELIVQQMI